MQSERRQRTTDEFADGGTDLLKRVMEPTLPSGDLGRYVVVDIDSGDYEVGDDDVTAINRLRARRPGAETYLCRVGEDAAERTTDTCRPAG